MTMDHFIDFVVHHDSAIRRDNALIRLRTLFTRATRALRLSLRRLFEGYDKNRNGMLSRSEMVRTLVDMSRARALSCVCAC